MRPALWVVVALTVATSACVSQGTYEAAQAELAACREQARGERDQYQRDRQKLESGLETAYREVQQCRTETEEAARRAEALGTREADLRQRLQTEIESRDVEIERLKDRLAVRVLDRILFRSGSADILPEGQAVLDKLAAALVQVDETIRVEGHTDDVPIGPRIKDKYFSNWELSGARAAAVVRYFQYHHRIDPLRLEAVGHAQYRPRAPNDTPENKQRNRRVEIVLSTRATADR